MSLRQQIAMQMNNATHTSSIHKSRIMFVFKYFLPRLQNVWGGWERVIRKYKDSHHLVVLIKNKLYVFTEGVYEQPQLAPFLQSMHGETKKDTLF